MVWDQDSNVHLLEMLTAWELSLQAAAFYFILESCEHQAERLEHFCENVGPAQGSTGEQRYRNCVKISNIPQLLLPPQPVYQTFISIFFIGKVWEQDYPNPTYAVKQNSDSSVINFAVDPKWIASRLARQDRYLVHLLFVRLLLVLSTPLLSTPVLSTTLTNTNKFF